MKIWDLNCINILKSRTCFIQSWQDNSSDKIQIASRNQKILLDGDTYICIDSSFIKFDSFQLNLSHGCLRRMIFIAMSIADLTWLPLLDNLLLDLLFVIFKLLDAQVPLVQLIKDQVLVYHSLQLLSKFWFILTIWFFNHIVTSWYIHLQHMNFLVQRVDHRLHLLFLISIDSLIIFKCLDVFLQLHFLLVEHIVVRLNGFYWPW
jgi:hypothetical protein